MLVLTLGAISPACAAIQFAYDLSGRLVQAVAPGGSAAQYQYDAAGNLLGVQQIANGTLAITSFAPASGPVGTTVTVAGAGFNPTASQNTVTFGGVATTVASATPDQLVVTVPVAAVTGPIVVTNTAGTATSATSFTVGPLLSGGSPAAEMTFGASAPGSLTFTGNVGDAWTLILNDINAGGATVTATVTQPGGNTVLANCSSSAATLICTLPPLPVAGTYTVSLTTSAATATVSMQLVADLVGGVLSPNTAATFAPSGSAPAVSYTFTASTGESDLALAFAADTIPGNASIIVYAPNGTTLTNTTLTSTTGSTQLSLGTLVAGTYRVRVIPGSLNAGSIQTTLVQVASGSTLTVGGPPLAVNLVAGQNGQYTFNGTQGQLLGIGITNLSSSGQSVSLTITGPGGTQVGNFSTAFAAGYALAALPATGPYTLTANPGANAASFNLLLSADQSGPLTTSGTPVAWSSTAVGQFVTYSFTSTAGQSYVLQLNGDTIPGSTSVYVYSPGGSTWTSTSILQSGNASIALNNAPTSGIYQVRVVPAVGGTGSLSMSLTQPSGGVLSVGASPVPVSISTGQSAVYSFTGAARQLLGVAFTDFSTVPAAQSVTLTLAGSNGAVVSTCNVSVSAYSRLNGAGCPLPALPANDTYTLVMSSGAASASFQINLVTDQTGTLAGNSAVATFASNSVGQSATYSLNGVAGQSYAVEVTGNSFLGSTNVYVYNPDGSLRISTYLSTGTSTQLDIGQVSATGTYLIRIEPVAWEAATDKILIETASTLTVGGAALSSNLVGIYTFSGVQGQNLGLGLANLSLTPSGGYAVITVTNPDGTRLGLFETYQQDGFALPMLPQTGAYIVTVDPGAAAASFNIQLLADQTGVLAINGAPTVFNSNSVGQNASYSFAGVAGQNYALALGANTFPGYAYIYVYTPDGAQWTSTTVSSINGQAPFTLPSAPVTGTYTVRVAPTQGTGSMSVGLTQNATGGALNAGPLNVNLIAGQTGTYTFSGTQGQALGLGLTNLSTTPSGQNVTVTIRDSSGTQLTSFYTSSATGYALPNLPVTGVYTVTINPGAAAASFNLQLTTDQAAALAIDGTPTVFNSSTVGQYASYSFAGVAGQNYALTLGANSFPGYTYVYVYTPDGAQWTSTWAYYSQTQFVLPSVPATGTYTVRVEPQGNATGGSMSVGLTQNASGATLSAGGASLGVSLVAGQTGTYTFIGAQGQALGLGLTNLSTTPGGQSVSVTITDSSGTRLASFSDSSPSSSYALPSLPVTGVYTVTINPGTAAASFNLQLTADQTGVLAINGTPTVFNPNSVGQNASYSFAGVAGQTYTLMLGANSFLGYTDVYVYAPDGAQWASTAVYSGGNGQTQYMLPSVPATGTYTVRVAPRQGPGSMSVGLTQNASGETLSAGGAPLSVSLVADQTGTYTFSGTQGQALGLGLTNLSTTPSGQNVTVTITDSSGTQLTSFYTSSATGYALPNLPVTGVYTVTINPGAAAASFNLQLTTDQAAALAIDGTPTVFNSSTVGQYASYSFAGVAGQNYALTLGANSFPGYTYVYVYTPDGAQWTSTWAYYSQTQFVLPSVPATGTYTVRVEPQGNATGGSMSVGLTQNASGGVLNAGPLNVNLIAGQIGTYTFSGTQGQALGLGVTNLSTTPGGQSVTMTIRDSSGTQLASFGTSSATGYALPSLPVTGVYTVMINPGAAAANFNLQLTTDQTAALTMNGTPTVFNSSTVGQYGSYTFAGVAGQTYALTLGASTIPQYTGVYVSAPDGTQLISTLMYSGYGPTQTLSLSVPATSTYTVRVEPQGNSTGSVSVGIAQTGSTTINNNGTGTLTTGGAPLAGNLTAGQIGTYTFSGTQGQSLGLGITNLSMTPSSGQYMAVTITDPYGTQLGSFATFSASSYALPILPVTGVYTVTINPGAAAASFNLQLTADQTGTLAINGAPTVFNTNTAGQSASYTFAGVAGQNYGLMLGPNSFPGYTYIYVYTPDGAQWTSTTVFPSNGQGQFTLSNVPGTGTYTVRVESNQGPGSISVGLTQNATGGAFSVGGAPLGVNLIAGQTGSYTFSGTRGQALGLSLTNLSTTPGGQSVRVTITDSSGTQLASFGTSSATNYALPTLPVTGVYTVTINPGAAAANFNLQLTADQTGVLAINGTPTVFNSGTVGQNASYSFAAVAGQNYGLVLGPNAFPGNATVYVYKPDGTQWTSIGMYSDNNQRQYTLLNAPATGTYTVRIEFAQGTGSVSVGLTQNAMGGTFSVGGTPLGVSLAAGQTGTYTFSGTQGQALGLGVTNLSTTPGGQSVNVTIRDSSGTQLASFNTSSVTGYALPTLPVTGVYTVTINPGTAAANFNLQLTADQTGGLAINGAPTVFNSSTVGQNASYSFAGVAGQNYALMLGPNTFPGSANVYVYKPDGTQWTSTQVYSDNSQRQFTLLNAPATGTYTVRIEFAQGTGSVSVGLSQNASITLSAGSGALGLNLVAGQTGTYTFSGTQGQALGLGITNLSMTPSSGQYMTVTIMDPDGTQLGSFATFSVSSYALPILPVAGVYTVTINPGAAAASFNLLLTADQTGTLAINGAPTVFNTNTAGQSASYTFAGVAGQNYGLMLGPNSFPGYTYVYVYTPDGAQWTSTTEFQGNGLTQVTLPNVPATGTYKVRVETTQGPGSTSVGLTQNATGGALSAGGAPLGVSLVAGQTGTYTFSGMQGQALGLDLTDLSTTPGGQSVRVTITDSSGTQLASFGTSSATNYALPTLPVTGVYTVTINPGTAAASFNAQLTTP